jgi:hypothetical protein
MSMRAMEIPCGPRHISSKTNSASASPRLAIFEAPIQNMPTAFIQEYSSADTVPHDHNYAVGNFFWGEVRDPLIYRVVNAMNLG